MKSLIFDLIFYSLLWIINMIFTQRACVMDRSIDARRPTLWSENNKFSHKTLNNHFYRLIFWIHFKKLDFFRYVFQFKSTVYISFGLDISGLKCSSKWKYPKMAAKTSDEEIPIKFQLALFISLILFKCFTMY